MKYTRFELKIENLWNGFRSLSSDYRSLYSIAPTDEQTQQLDDSTNIFEKSFFYSKLAMKCLHNLKRHLHGGLAVLARVCK